MGLIRCPTKQLAQCSRVVALHRWYLQRVEGSHMASQQRLHWRRWQAAEHYPSPYVRIDCWQVYAKGNGNRAQNQGWDLYVDHLQKRSRYHSNMPSLHAFVTVFYTRTDPERQGRSQ